MEELLSIVDRGVIYTLNVDHLMLLQKDHHFYSAYKNADFVLLDSQVIFLLFKLVRKPFKEKISGSDLFPRFCEYYKNNENIKIFVLGGLGNVAVKVQEILNENAGRQIVVGAYSPSFCFDMNPSECEEIVKQINNSRATVVIVGVGAPKQEKWINLYKDKLPTVKIFMAVGATLDFIAGKEIRAPKWIQKIGLEWLFRLLQNPKRFAKRYLLRDMQFFYYFILERLSLYKDPFGSNN